MGDKEFHQMLGVLIDTHLKEFEKISDEESLKREAIKRGISLESKDVTDLSRVLEEIRTIKAEGKLKLASPRN